MIYIGLALLMPLLPLAAFVPGLLLLVAVDPAGHPFLFLGAAPLAGAMFVVLLASGVTVLKWLLVGRIRPRTDPVHGGFYIRKWIADRLMGLALENAGSLHATLYLAPWYRALGARIGRFVELSTATSITPDLLRIDDGGTIADEASLSAASAARRSPRRAPTSRPRVCWWRAAPSRCSASRCRRPDSSSWRPRS